MANKRCRMIRMIDFIINRAEEALLQAYAHKEVCTKQHDGESSLTFSGTST